ncbi:hypothetical protein ACLIYP_28920 [Streptomyces nanhaiensis]|uniref:hypothetical protein n=1 Tax=Streptomyces nanhaiensis TaxID=679319 RepID=UPI00399D055C
MAAGHRPHPRGHRARPGRGQRRHRQQRQRRGPRQRMPGTQQLTRRPGQRRPVQGPAERAAERTAEPAAQMEEDRHGQRAPQRAVQARGERGQQRQPRGPHPDRVQPGPGAYARVAADRGDGEVHTGGQRHRAPQQPGRRRSGSLRMCDGMAQRAQQQEPHGSRGAGDQRPPCQRGGTGGAY